MIPVYQKVIDKDNGDCMRAVMASLFELKLEDVPNFIEAENWFLSMFNFLNHNGCSVNGYLYGGNLVSSEFHLHNISKYDGINGYFYASVYSPKYNPYNSISGVTHAVVVDKNLNVVHDPNPENKDHKNYTIDHIMIIEKIKL